LKRRYLTAPIHHNMFTFIPCFISYHFITISLLLCLCDIHQIT
jgi:hypothetical protein